MNFKSSVLAAATIDTKGGGTRQAVLSNDDYICLSMSFSKIDENSVLVVSDLFKIFKKNNTVWYHENQIILK
jgi:hypothetical protein